MDKDIVFIDLPLNQPMDEIFVVLAKDKRGNEGIIDFNGLPLVFGEMGTLQTIIDNLSRIAKMANNKIQLCRYVKKEVIKEI